MKRYIIKNVDEKFYNAASKARRDADAIAREYGYEPVPFSDVVTANHSHLMQISMALSCLVNGVKMLFRVERNSIVLLQYPQFPIKASYFLRVLIPAAKKLKGIRFVSLIHDLDSLRGLCGRTGIYCDRKVLPLMDAIICHNEAMKRYLVKKGIPKEKLIVLGIFDYLTNAAGKEHNPTEGITIAGNLDPKKSGYIDGIKGVIVHLYGNGRETFPDSAIYHGAYPPEDLPGVIEGGFGLVWDGNKTDCCDGAAGKYLRINDPHKLSLYLASGMPVIVWKKAAVARFVEDKGVGFAVENLEDAGKILAGMPEDEYRQMAGNVKELSDKIRNGVYFKTALEMAEEMLHN